MAKEKSAIGVLAEYFGRLPGQNLKDFRDEVAKLTERDKHELAELAAAELGITLRA